MTYLDAARALGAFGDGVRASAYGDAPSPGDAADLGALAADWNGGLRDAAALGLEPQAAATLAGGAVAACIHAWAQTAYATRSAGGLAPADLDALDAVLDGRLRMLRRSASTGSLAGAGRILAELASRDAPALAAAAAAAPPPSGDPAGGAIAVHVARLTRRMAALAAGVAQVQRRLATPRLLRTTAGIAARRVVAAAPRPPIADAAISLEGIEPLTRLAVLARVSAVTWVDAGSRPHSRCDLEAGGQLRVHFRNVRLDGVAGDRWVWARAKVEPPAPDGTRYAVAEFEGPTTTAAAVWESWLAVEARAAYDIAPRSVDLVCELADPRSTAGRLDLLSRISPDEGGA